jgi:drug/metabolite transporter (DMT)-like permease
LAIMPGDSRGPDPINVSTVLALAIAVIAVSSSGPLIAYAVAPALAIAFWRNAAAAALLTPLAATRRRAEMAALFGRTGRPALISCLLAGVALAVHFATWVPSAKMTNVASSVALVATQPVWQACIAKLQGRHVPSLVWLGIGIAVAGAIAATGAAVTISPRAVAGDLLALAGGIAVAVYTSFGERARATISTIGYTTICYGVCAVVLSLTCLIGGVQMTGYPARSWLAIAGLVVGAQLLGHSLLNYALRHVAATTVSVLILLEVPGAAVLAFLWLHQSPPAASLPGLALLPIGVLVVVLGSRRVASAARADQASDAPSVVG